MAVVHWIALIYVVATIYNPSGLVGASDIGVCYGMLGNDLPAASDVINLYKQNSIGKMRLFDPNPPALEALRGSGIGVTVGVPNQELENLASSQDAVNGWFDNIAPYINDIALNYIAVGNEIIPGSLGNYVLPVMRSLQNILNDKGLQGTKVTTVLPGIALGSSYPPSSGVFAPEASGVMTDILQFLASTGSPLMINVYPYFAYKADPEHVSLEYAIFTSETAVVQDGEYSYKNLFDAQVDAFLAAMEKAGGQDVRVVVSESGWPSDGSGSITTIDLAQKYNQNLMNHCLGNQGTPRRPGGPIEAYIFAMFNENQKPSGEEQHFGLFYPNMEPVYDMPFR